MNPCSLRGVTFGHLHENVTRRQYSSIHLDRPGNIFLDGTYHSGFYPKKPAMWPDAPGSCFFLRKRLWTIVDENYSGLLIKISRVMTKIEKLEQEIKELSPAEFVSFRDWFTKYDADVWDAQIEEDVHSGRMATIADKALSDYQDGKARTL